MMSSEIMTAEEVAEYLRIPLQTLYQWRYLGRGPKSSKLGRHLRYRRADVDAWVDEHSTAA